MRRYLSRVLIVVLSVAASGQLVRAVEPGVASGVSVDAMDRGADACTDFYRFACGGWMSANPLPPDRSRWGQADALQERNQALLRDILEHAASAPGSDAEARKAGDYYAACMDEPAIDAGGVSPILPSLKAVDAIRGPADLPRLLAALHDDGVDAFFGFAVEPDPGNSSVVIATVDQGGISLPDRDYYLKTDAASVTLREKHAAHVAKLLALAGTSQADAARQAAAVARVEHALAQASMSRVDRREPSKLYHKQTPAELKALAPGFDWTTYFGNTGAPHLEAINVATPDFVRAATALMTSAPLDDLKAYLRWQVVHAHAFLLAKPFVDENFDFYGRALSGAVAQRPRWKRCVSYVQGDLPDVVGRLYVERAFGGDARDRTRKLIEAFERAMGDDIRSVDWMSPDTRNRALAKLQAISNDVGMPQKWHAYDALRIARGDALGNHTRSYAFELRRQLATAGGPVDRTEWSLTTPEVNADYTPQFNRITFTAGILQPPFFSASRDEAVNVGALGSVVGHELTHGYDDEGRQYDAAGNLKDWWTDADAKAFSSRADCFVSEYDGFTAVDDVKLNGRLTLGENVADNGGMRLAFAVLQRLDPAPAPAIDGFTPEQRFFMGFAQSSCENVRPELSRMLATIDVHSPGRYRVNGTVMNMPEFRKAFGCAASTPMARQNACRVW